MNQTEETKLLEYIEQWNDADEFSRCIEAIEAIPEQERGYLLTVKLSRAYSNLAVLGLSLIHISFTMLGRSWETRPRMCSVLRDSKLCPYIVQQTAT